MKTTFNYYCFLALLLISTLGFAQEDTNKWRALLGVGFNSPSQSGLITPFEARGLNFPTIHLGVQHMLTQELGVRVDYGYNRFSNTNKAPDFKINYNRVNAQVVYNVPFLFEDIGFLFHAGPGYTMIKPLDIYRDNKTSYLNAMAGLELSYILSDTVSLFVDGSYIFGFADDFDPVIEGAGSFNGNVFALTFGATISLINCRTCN